MVFESQSGSQFESRRINLWWPFNFYENIWYLISFLKNTGNKTKFENCFKIAEFFLNTRTGKGCSVYLR